MGARREHSELIGSFWSFPMIQFAGMLLSMKCIFLYYFNSVTFSFLLVFSIQSTQWILEVASLGSQMSHWLILGKVFHNAQASWGDKEQTFIIQRRCWYKSFKSHHKACALFFQPFDILINEIWYRGFRKICPKKLVGGKVVQRYNNVLATVNKLLSWQLVLLWY